MELSLMFVALCALQVAAASPAITIDSSQGSRVQLAETAPIGTEIAHFVVTDPNDDVVCHVESEVATVEHILPMEFKVTLKAALVTQLPTHHLEIVCIGSDGSVATKPLTVEVLDENSPIALRQVENEMSYYGKYRQDDQMMMSASSPCSPLGLFSLLGALVISLGCYLQ